MLRGPALPDQKLGVSMTETLHTQFTTRHIIAQQCDDKYVSVSC